VAHSHSRRAARLGEAGAHWGAGDRAGQPDVLPRHQITTPDRVESRLSTLTFEDGIPDNATNQKVFDELDYGLTLYSA
jgi:hypothetical protein